MGTSDHELNERQSEPGRSGLKGARVREQILRVATDVIIETGPTVRMDEIARRAQVSTKTIYVNFRDRSELLRQVAIDMLRQSTEEARAALAEEPDAFTALARFMHDSMDLRLGTVTSILDPFLPNDDDLIAVRREYREAQEALVSAAHKEGSLRPDVTAGDISLLIGRFTSPLPRAISPEDSYRINHRHVELVLDGLSRFGSSQRLPGPAISMRDFLERRPTSEEDYARIAIEIRSGERSSWWLSQRIAIPERMSTAVSVYLDTSDREVVEPLLTALQDLFATEGLTLDADGEPKVSSWWGRFAVRTKDGASDDALKARLQKIEHALEVVAVRQPMSIENVKQAEAVSALASAVENVSNAVILAGSIVMVKWIDEHDRPQLYAKTLSVAEIREFERNQHLLTNPHKALQHLHLLARASQTMELPSNADANKQADII